MLPRSGCAVLRAGLHGKGRKGPKGAVMHSCLRQLHPMDLLAFAATGGALADAAVEGELDRRIARAAVRRALSRDPGLDRRRPVRREAKAVAVA